MIKKAWESMRKDWLIVLLDIISVNAAYFLALLVRFYVNFKFMKSVTYLLTAFWHFAPFYTVLAIATFAAFKLYGGMWKFSGINDMNRIVEACLVTTVIQIIGTALFVTRMPITYYCIGAVLQFCFVVLSRFGYRIFLVEKKKLFAKNTPMIPAMVIGAGEKARKAIGHLDDSAYRVTVIVDEKSAGKSLDGIPVVGSFEVAADSVRAVFIADPKMPEQKKKEIRDQARTLGLEVQDYTGYLSNMEGRIPLTGLMELMEGPVTVCIGEQETEYKSGEEALKALNGRYNVIRMKGTRIELEKAPDMAYLGYEDWAKQHREETGEEISFF